MSRAEPTALTAAAAPQLGLFQPIRTPVVAAWGAGVDSTAMLIEMIERGEAPDLVLFADTGAEKPQTYEFVRVFSTWLEARNVPLAIVRYEASNFKNYPAYRTIDENAFSNGTLPSLAFGRHSCSLKWKVAPQDKYLASWEPAQTAWAAGGKVVKWIGYDCSPADKRRYAHAQQEGHCDPRFVYRYPLVELGWTRSDCIARIRRAGVPVPDKSACFMCPASKPAEIDALPAGLLRRIVLMEARAAPRLRNIEGLWRTTVKGCRGATPRPGSMTTYIRERGLLPADEIDEIQSAAPVSLAAFQAATGSLPIGERPELSAWLKLFDLRDRAAFDAEGVQRLYGEEPTPA